MATACFDIDLKTPCNISSFVVEFSHELPLQINTMYKIKKAFESRSPFKKLDGRGRM